MKKLLLVEDEVAIREFEAINLQRAGYITIQAGSGEEALEIYDSEPNTFDIALLDISMPGMDGFTLCRELRKRSASLGIIMLTARAQEMDKINGLMLGADDYMTKPFLPRELILRLNIILRRTYFPITSPKPNAKPIFMLGNTKIDLNSGNVTSPDSNFTLTAKEFALLEKLYANKNHIVTIDALCEAAWNDTIFGYENSLMVHIRRLRAKIEATPSTPKYLLTVRGLGYKLVVEE